MKVFRLSLGLLAVLLSSPGSEAGVYLGTVNCRPGSVPASSDFCIQGETNIVRPPSFRELVTPFGVVHPLGYDGSGGLIEVEVCAATPELSGATQAALATWNALVPTVGQCRRCYLVEEDPALPTETTFNAESTILHELGHCAMGLGHPNLQFDPPGGPDVRVITSYTMSYDGSSAGIPSGADGIRGSFDDSQDTPGGGISTSVHWFRRSDNNPVIIDGTVIELATYSRSITTGLPSGHGWAANANQAVAASLGATETQTPMYSFIAPSQRYAGLTADDVNMVKMGMTGQDRMAGTADDYSISLVYVDDCLGADIAVSFADLGVGGSIAACFSDLDFSFPQPNPLLAQHYSVIVPSGFGMLTVELNSNVSWDFRREIFYDGFESGDLSGWTNVVP